MPEPRKPRKAVAKKAPRSARAKVTPIGTARKKVAGGRPKGQQDTTRIKAAERRARVMALRRQQHSYPEIARMLGISVSTAHGDFKQALADVPSREVEDYRAEIAESQEWLMNKAAGIIQWGTTMEKVGRQKNQLTGEMEDVMYPRDADIAVKYMSQMRSALNDYAELLGAKMPVQVDISGSAYQVNEFDNDVRAHLARIDAARAQRALEMSEAARDIIDTVEIKPTPAIDAPADGA
jgi:AraC-like DNA-binding protein